MQETDNDIKMGSGMDQDRVQSRVWGLWCQWGMWSGGAPAKVRCEQPGSGEGQYQ